ncbi:MAG: CCA tRNA nucleotidyltransferase [Nitrososphaerales archaeon]
MKTQNSKLDLVISRARELVTPTEGEKDHLALVTNVVETLLQAAFKGEHVVPEITLGGSFAKGTWLRSSADIDFFLAFPVDFPREKLEGETIKLLQHVMKDFEIKLRFAEHPYVEAFVEGARVNLVPCYKVEKGKWQSAVDRSPFHAEYIKNNFDQAKRLETRLLKRFAKGIGVYGAEVKTQGLSGYVCEVLILKFSSFVSVLEYFSKVARGEIISIEPFDNDLARSLTSPIVILDPVDTTRNLGSAISSANLSKLILASRAFLAHSSLSYFKEQKKQVKPNARQRKLLQNVAVVSFKTKERSVDILWGQLKKSLGALSNKLELSGYTTIREKALSNEKDESAFIFLLEESKISNLHTRSGPDVFRGEDFAKYVKKNRRRALLSFLSDEGKVVSIFERENNDVFLTLNRLLKDQVAIRSIGLSKVIQKEIRSCKIESGKTALRLKKDWLVRGIVELVTEGQELNDAT